jgi:hypothetical protein
LLVTGIANPQPPERSCDGSFGNILYVALPGSLYFTIDDWKDIKKGLIK